MKAVIVGSGLSGITSAILLKQLKYDVEIFESREHIGGNCYDKLIGGVSVHMYGPHAFNTNKKYVWDFLNRYTKFNDVSLKVKAETDEGIIPIPFNKTSEELIGKKTPEEIKKLIFIDYSEKMWGTKWKDIPKSITSRVPITRQSHDDRYHLKKYQGIPVNGYTNMFKSMLEGIKVQTGIPKEEWKKQKKDLLIFTGKIDEYFNYCFGKLEYRSIRFEYSKEPQRDTMQLNQCNKKPWTREVDHSHWLKQKVKETIISKEYPLEHDESNIPFYPKPFHKNIKTYQKYKNLANKEEVIFVGRLATYKYLDMDDAIAQTFQIIKQKI